MMRLKRAGITLTETIVLVLLLLVVAGLVLAMLPRLWRTSYRTVCTNNLKRIGEGVYFFEGAMPPHLEGKDVGRPAGVAHGFLPPARIADKYATWAALIAPYMTNSHPLQKWDISKTYYDQKEAVRKATFKWYFCPARHRQTRFSASGDVPKQRGKHVAGAVGDYACASGTEARTDRWKTADATGALILGRIVSDKDDKGFRWRSRTAFPSFKRGLSNTILVGEKHVPPAGVGKAEFGDGSIYNGHNPGSFSRVGGVGFPIAATPNAPYRYQFGSAHDGVCHFVMADCTVRPMSTAMSVEVLGRLIERE